MTADEVVDALCDDIRNTRAKTFGDIVCYLSDFRQGRNESEQEILRQAQEYVIERF